LTRIAAKTGIDFYFDTEHEFLALCLGFDFFWGELSGRRHKRHRCGKRSIGKYVLFEELCTPNNPLSGDAGDDKFITDLG
jgi:hypothetical protein